MQGLRIRAILKEVDTIPTPPNIPSTVTDKSHLGPFKPVTTPGSRWQHWFAVFDHRTCQYCFKHGNKMRDVHQLPLLTLKVHDYCRCLLRPLESLAAGTASWELTNGADYWIVHYGVLPPYYRTEAQLNSVGWRYGKKPSQYMPGVMYTNGIFQNHDHVLPDSPGRIWYEADLNYYHGKRNKHRVVWSNDGLVFVTYEHYITFIEAKRGNHVHRNCRPS